MQNNPQAIQDAMRIANSPLGQQLFQLLQQSSGKELNQAMEKAASGDYAAVKMLLENLMHDPKAQQLFNKMGGSHGSDGR